MKRNVNLEEITDGRFYNSNDMVKADAHGCKGCHLCCTGMGESVILDPLDMWRLTCGTGKDLQALLAEGSLELHAVDGCILPNLSMSGDEEACRFLNGEGRCSIHAYRPGICRLFPLGRIYENGDFKYILQTGECPVPNCSKVKVEKWIDTPNQKRNHEFLCAWHYFLKNVEETVAGLEDSQVATQLNMAILNGFYTIQAATEEEFYNTFFTKLQTMKNAFNWP